MCRLYTCITCVKHVYYMCSTHVLQVYELHICNTLVSTNITCITYSITCVILMWHISWCNVSYHVFKLTIVMSHQKLHSPTLLYTCKSCLQHHQYHSMSFIFWLSLHYVTSSYICLVIPYHFFSCTKVSSGASYICLVILYYFFSSTKGSLGASYICLVIPYHFFSCSKVS